MSAAKTVPNQSEHAAFLTTWFALAQPGELIEVRPLRKYSDGPRKHQEWFDAAAPAIAYVEQCMAIGNDVYIGTLPRARRAGGADAIASYRWAWGDLDYGTEGHAKPAPFATRADALASIRAVEKRISAKATFIVDTGGGFHAWWALSESAPFETWRTAIDRLGYLLGADMTALDPARILRVPGTFNFKVTPRRPVRLVQNIGTYIDVAKLIELPEVPESVLPKEQPKREPKGDRTDGPFTRANDVPIAEVLAWLGVEMHAEGSRTYCACPVCPGDDTHEMAVGGRSNVASCFGDCAAGPGRARAYTPVDLVAGARRVDPREAVNVLASAFRFDGFSVPVKRVEVPATSPEHNPLENLAARLLASTDRATIAFAEDLIDAAADVAVKSPAQYESIRETIKRANVGRVSVWDAAVQSVVAEKRASTKAASGGDWRDHLVFENGVPKATEANCIAALTHAPDWDGVLAFNEFANNPVKRRSPPWHADDIAAGADTMGEWSEGDDIRLLCWFQRELQMDAKLPMVMHALHVVAARNSFHPVREYLDGLKWDGVQRLPTWLARYAGAKTQSAAYLSRVGTWFLISAVARIYRPGCQVDHSIILEGKQGARKSTLVRRLVPNEEWFAEHNANLSDKDAYAILNGRWFLELAELDSLSKAEVGKIKRYMTTPTDSYRPVWARRVGRFPRHCVFIGTVNESQYLRDATGNRRFWPVAVGAIDIDALVRDRDQLLAEAVHWFREGAEWWPGRDDEKLLESEQEERLRVDVWEEPIAAWLAAWLDRPDHGKYLTSTAILSGAIRRPVADQTVSDEQRIGAVMARLGWCHSQSREANDNPNDRDRQGKRRRVWAYSPPPPPPPSAPADTE